MTSHYKIFVLSTDPSSEIFRNWFTATSHSNCFESLMNEIPPTTWETTELRTMLQFWSIFLELRSYTRSKFPGPKIFLDSVPVPYRPLAGTNVPTQYFFGYGNIMGNKILSVIKFTFGKNHCCIPTFLLNRYLDNH